HGPLARVAVARVNEPVAGIPVRHRPVLVAVQDEGARLVDRGPDRPGHDVVLSSRVHRERGGAPTLTPCPARRSLRPTVPPPPPPFADPRRGPDARRWRRPGALDPGLPP